MVYASGGFGCKSCLLILQILRVLFVLAKMIDTVIVRQIRFSDNNLKPSSLPSFDGSLKGTSFQG